MEGRGTMSPSMTVTNPTVSGCYASSNRLPDGSAVPDRIRDSLSGALKFIASAL